MSSLRAGYRKLMAEAEAGSAEAAKERLKLDMMWEYIFFRASSLELIALLSSDLPVPENSKAKKMILLKVLSLALDSSSSSASSPEEEDHIFKDHILKELESLEGLYQEEGAGESRADLLMRLQVLQLLFRVELVARELRKNNMPGFEQALEKYWSKDIVPDTEQALVEDPEVSALKKQASEDLWKVKDRPNQRSFILVEYAREGAVNKLQEFLKLAWEEVGPIVLENVAQDMLDGTYIPGKKRGTPEGARLPSSKRVKKPLLPSLSAEADAGNGLEQEENSHHADVDDGTCVALDALRRSKSNLREQVQDPLPAAIELAVELKKTNGSGSILERNHTAKTTQWSEDEIEEDGSPSASRRVQLPKDVNSAGTVTPLAISESGGKAEKGESSKGRRRKNKWNDVEEQTLRNAVAKIGKGRWKAILNAHKDVFVHRSEVDLKDKWRNIERADKVK